MCSRRLRATLLAVAAAFAIYTLAGFFAVPVLVRYLARGRLAAALHRPVSIGTVRFNPFTLRLSADDLRVGERGGGGDFGVVGSLRLKASWTSFYRWAPVLEELTIDRPMLHLVRGPERRFNFSDLLETSASQTPAPSSAAALHFAISNIRLNQGRILFDDQAFHAQHRIEQIQIGVPFIANLPADVEIFVQPLLRMVIDGSPVRLMGITKPFASTRESTLELRLRKLDLTRMAGYVAQALPLELPSGTLSADVQVHFMQPQSGPVIRLSGSLEMDGLDLRDASNGPLLSVKRAAVELTDVEPVRQILILGPIEVEGLAATLTLNRNGTSNLTPLAAAIARSKGGTKSDQQSAMPYVFIGSFDLADGALAFSDKSAPVPAAVALNAVHIGFKNFATNKRAAPIPFQFQARLGQGSVAMTGSLDLPHSHAAIQAALEQIDLPPLQAFAPAIWAGTVVTGKFGAHAQLQTDFSAGRFNVVMQPATASLDAVELRPPDETQPLTFNHLSAAVDRFDLAGRRAALKELRIEGLRLSARRGADGRLSLAAFLHPGAEQSAQNASGPWQYRIQSLAIENAETAVQDDSLASPLTLESAPLNVHLKDVSSDLSQPFGLEIDGTLKPRGSFKVEGTASISPPAAALHVITSKVDLTPAVSYIEGRLNAKLTRAALTTAGDLEIGRAQENFRLRYRGDVTVVNLRMRDKLTNERFLSWGAFSARRIDAELGTATPRIEVGELALADFYARLILNSDGKLNLNDVIAGPRAPATSLTRAKPGPSVQPPPLAAPSGTPAPEASPALSRPALGADVSVGRLTLAEGHVNFTDHFIKPHYTADLTDIAGKVGGFGTRAAKPAQVELQGQINSSAPVDITGLIDPLAPQAFVDIRAKAQGIELTNLSPYSAKYTGYPIVKGTLNADLHYLLEHRRLSATNHLFISQLTFGDKVPSPSALNLPIALAVSLLKNARGEIDLTVPVSGSLNDPRFSIGAVVGAALTNLVMKIVSSPFSVLASVAGASRGQRLDYVEFQPGQATLTPDSLGKLSTLAKAMQDRPGLRLTISGRADPVVDRDGLRVARVERQIKAQKARELREQGENVETGDIVLSPEEYDKYLKQAYKRAKFDKPRNFLGLVKSLPPEEMKKLMLANTPVTDDDLKELAGARAAAVRRYLSKQVDPVRLAVVAPTLAQGSRDKGRSTRVELAIE